MKKQEVEAEQEDRLRLETVSRVRRGVNMLYIRCYTTLYTVMKPYSTYYTTFYVIAQPDPPPFLQVKKQEVEAEQEDRLRLETVSRVRRGGVSNA